MLFGVNWNAEVLTGMLDLEKNPMPEFSDFISWTDDKGVRYFDWKYEWYGDELEEARDKFVEDAIKGKYYPMGRFRDCYLTPEKDKIVLYTRNWGGNRDSYNYVFRILSKHPNYIGNYDDDFDCTYAYIEFSIPDEFKEDIKNIESAEFNPSEKFQILMDNLSKK